MTNKELADKYERNGYIDIASDMFGEELKQVIAALRAQPASPTWRLVHRDELPSGSPVAPGSRLYAFYLAPVGAHWEYDLPDVPTPQKGGDGN